MLSSSVTFEICLPLIALRRSACVVDRCEWTIHFMPPASQLCRWLRRLLSQLLAWQKYGGGCGDVVQRDDMVMWLRAVISSSNCCIVLR